MKNKTSGIFATIFFTLISILFVSPILIVLMNSFKKKAFISLEPSSRLDRIYYRSLCYRYPRMLFHVCMVHYPRTKQDYKINLPFMRIFHGNSFPDGYVHFIRNC